MVVQCIRFRQTECRSVERGVVEGSILRGMNWGLGCTWSQSDLGAGVRVWGNAGVASSIGQSEILAKVLAF
jgi:hypothetical protein